MSPNDLWKASMTQICPSKTPFAMAPADLLIEIALFLETSLDILNFSLTVRPLYFESLALFNRFISILSHSMSFWVSHQSFTRPSCCTLLNSAPLLWECWLDDSTLLDMCESLWLDLKQSTIISALPTTLLCLQLYNESQVQWVWMPWSSFNGMQKKCRFWRTCGLPCVLGVSQSYASLGTDMSSKIPLHTGARNCVM